MQSFANHYHTFRCRTVLLCHVWPFYFSISPSFFLFSITQRQLQEYGEQVLGVRFDTLSLPDATEAAIRSVEEFASANQSVS